MKQLTRALDKLWFSPAPAERLAALRILTGVYTLYYLLTHRRSLMNSASAGPDVFQPIGVTTWMTAPMSLSLFQIIVGACILFANFFIFGIWHRVFAPIFAGLLLFVLTYSNSWTMVFHTENMLVLHVIVLALAPAANAYSLDVIYSEERPGLQRFFVSKRATEAHFRFHWPIKVLQLGATLPYVVAGIAKVRGKAGWEWAEGANLRDQITMNGLYYDVFMGQAPEITYHVYGWDRAFMFAASLTLVIELCSPLALLHRWAGYVYVVNIMGMHWGIMVLMGIPFPYQLYGWAYVCFFDWDRIIAFVNRRISPWGGGAVGRFIEGVQGVFGVEKSA